jgi:hypothetical protein
MVDSGFLKQQHKDQLIFETDEEQLLRKVLSTSNNFGDKWW